eukprot:762490-Hanusia_phi.AAC.1
MVRAIFGTRSFLGFSSSGRLAGTCLPQTAWISVSSMVSLIPQGLLSSSAIAITSHVSVSSLSDVFSYDKVSMFSVSNSLTLVLNNQVLMWFSMAGRIGLSAASNTQWISYSAVACRTSAVMYNSNSVSMSVSKNVASISEAFSADSKMLVQSTNFLPLNHQYLYADGSHITKQFSWRARIAFSAVSSSVWVSDSVISCQMPSGSGFSLPMMLTSATQVKSQTESLSYDRYSTQSSGFNSQSPKMISLVMGLTNSVRSSSFVSRLGMSSAPATVWTSSSSLKLMMCQGSGGSLRMVISANSVNTFSSSVTYDIARVSLVQDSNSPCAAPDAFIVIGANLLSFSSTPTIRMQGTSVESSRWTSQSSILCLKASGVGSSLSLACSVAGLSSASTAISFDSPLVANYQGINTKPLDALDGLYVLGQSFGGFRSSLSARALQTAAQSTRWQSDSSVLVFPAAGIGRISPKTVMTVATRAGTGVAVVTFDGPLISIVSFRQDIFARAIPPQPNFPTTGGSPSTITGGNFGARETTLRVKMQGSAPIVTKWLSDTGMLCKVPRGLGSFNDIVASVCIVVSGTLSYAWSFDLPRISSNSPGNSAPVADPAASHSLTIYGTNFGTSVNSEESRLGQSSCAATSWSSDCQVVSRISNGFGVAHKAVLTAGLQRGSSLKVFSFDSPSLDFIQVQTTTGERTEYEVFGTGQNYGATSQTMAVRVGSSACERSSWSSDTSASARAADGVGASLGVSITSMQLIASASSLFDYSLGQVTAVLPTNSPTNGNDLLTIFGNEFGISDYSLVAKVGQTNCMRTLWISSTSLECFVPSGQPMESANLFISIGRRVSTGSAQFSYNRAPHLEGLLPNFGPTSGGYVVTATGNLISISDQTEIQMWKRTTGQPVLYKKICANSVNCTGRFVGSTRQGDTATISFVMPAGIGSDISLYYYDSSTGPAPFQYGYWEPTFSYEKPSVVALISNSWKFNVTELASGLLSVDSITLPPVIGNRVVTILGSSFGGYEGSLIVQLGTLATVTANRYGSHSSCAFEVPGFSSLQSLPLSLSLSVAVNDRSSDSINNAIVLVRESLPFNLIFDANFSYYNTPQRLNDLRSYFTRTCGALLKFQDDISELKRIMILNVTRGSVRISFIIMNSPQNDMIAFESLTILLAAYKSGQLQGFFPLIGSTVEFEAVGYVAPTTTPTTTETSTTPVPTTILVTTPPPKSGWQPLTIGLLSGGVGLGVLFLFCCLVVTIRRTLHSDEVMIKSALDALANQSAMSIPEGNSQLSPGIVAMQREEMTPRDPMSMSTRTTLSNFPLSPRVHSFNNLSGYGALQSPNQFLGISRISEMYRQSNGNSSMDVEQQPMQYASTPSSAPREDFSPRYEGSLIRKQAAAARASYTQSPRISEADSKAEQGAQDWMPRWKVPSPGQIRAMLIPSAASSVSRGSVDTRGENEAAASMPVQSGYGGMSDYGLMGVAVGSDQQYVNEQPVQLESARMSVSTAQDSNRREERQDPDQDEDNYFSASDPESSLQQRFENLDDQMSLASLNSTAYSGQKTRSQLFRPSRSHRSQRSTSRSQQNTPARPASRRSRTSISRPGPSVSRAMGEAQASAGEAPPPLPPAAAPATAAGRFSTGAAAGGGVQVERQAAVTSGQQSLSWLEGHRDLENLFQSPIKPSLGNARAAASASGPQAPLESDSDSDSDGSNEQTIGEQMSRLRTHSASEDPLQTAATVDTLRFADAGGQLTSELDLDDESVATLGFGAVYVSLAPVSRAHAVAERRADDSWIHTPLRPGRRAPENTPAGHSKESDTSQGGPKPSTTAAREREEAMDQQMPPRLPSDGRLQNISERVRELEQQLAMEEARGLSRTGETFDSRPFMSHFRPDQQQQQRISKFDIESRLLGPFFGESSKAHKQDADSSQMEIEDMDLDSESESEWNGDVSVATLSQPSPRRQSEVSEMMQAGTSQMSIGTATMDTADSETSSSFSPAAR